MKSVEKKLKKRKRKNPFKKKAVCDFKNSLLFDKTARNLLLFCCCKKEARATMQWSHVKTFEFVFYCFYCLTSIFVLFCFNEINLLFLPFSLSFLA